MRPRRLDAPHAPHLEPLEDRTLMSTCHVTRLSDTEAGFGFRGDLRYCINKVNAEPGANVIDFHVTGTISLSSALPDLDSEIAIQGPGANLLTIDAQQKARVFYVEEGASVEISGLTLAGGRAQNSERGGGVYNEGGLALQNCSIKDNTGFGYGGGISNSGTLLISNSSITGNSVRPFQTFYTWGGGIYNAVNGVLLVHGSLIAGNKIEPSFSWVALGGGIANLGQAAVFNSTISANTANPPNISTIGGFGGGIYNGADLRVENSLISMNVAAGDYWGYGGGIANGYTYYAGNQKYVPGGPLTVINSTISHNLAYGNGESFSDSRGGGISSVPGGTMTIKHSTIARNSADRFAGSVNASGGGLFNQDGSTLDLHNTIVSHNRAATNGRDFFGILTSSGYNLFQDSTGGSGYAETDLLDVAAMLGPLQDNGGPTPTIALLPGSPAIDAGDNTDAPEFDQRGPGFPRIVNGTIDIGAFEVQSTGAPSFSRPSSTPRADIFSVMLVTPDYELFM